MQNDHSFSFIKLESECVYMHVFFRAIFLSSCALKKVSAVKKVRLHSCNDSVIDSLQRDLRSSVELQMEMPK